MRIISSTGKNPEDIIVIDMTREQFNQLMHVACVAHTAAEEGCIDSIEWITKVVNFYNALINIQTVHVT